MVVINKNENLDKLKALIEKEFLSLNHEIYEANVFKVVDENGYSLTNQGEIC